LFVFLHDRESGYTVYDSLKIKKFVNAGDQDKIIAAGSGTTGALKKLKNWQLS